MPANKKSLRSRNHPPPPRRAANVQGPNHSLAMGLVPLTETLLATREYTVTTGFHPPYGHVPSCCFSRHDSTPLIAEHTPQSGYNTAPRWLVGSPPADSVAPLLEALIPRTVLRIFDEADPRDVDRFVQLCLHLGDQWLLALSTTVSQTSHTTEHRSTLLPWLRV